MRDNADLAQVRQRIDDIDGQLLRLLSERAEAAQEVARIKLSADPEAQFYRPEREAEVLRKVQADNAGPLPDETVGRIFREVMSACLALERRMRVAYLGPQGTFTQAAVLKHFGHAVETVSLGSIGHVFREVEAGACDYGVVPVENSTEGVISHTLDMFMSSPVRICGEVALRIHQCLLGNLGRLSDIDTVYSHQQSLAQCRGWLLEHLPEARLVPSSSNAEAAIHAAREKGCAAIAGETAAEIYGLGVMARNIEDDPQNTTRFLIIGRESVPASEGPDKTSILLSCPNRSGALYDLLQPFARHGISMTRIESRPSRKGPWDYVFFIDLEGHQQQDATALALREVEKNATFFKILGSYPRAVL
jgi:chorismate mutase/prephenate dehydratase